MNLLSLQAIPNQSFTIVLDTNRYDFRVFETNGVMAVTVQRNDVLIIDSMRVTLGTLLLPYEYQENGNFYFTSVNEELIYYPNFGSTQNLFYLTPDDLAAMRGT